jgi:hypothetical protein
MRQRCLLYPQKRTFGSAKGMSAKGQKRTSRPTPFELARRQAPRGKAVFNGTALRISFGLLCRHLHRNIGHG